MKKEDVLQAIGEMMQKIFEEKQNAPNQFIVAYYRMSDDTLVGYHLDTFCNVTDDILDAKRYSSEDPYPQLAIIAKNLKFALDKEMQEGDMSYSICKRIRSKFGNLKSSEVYMDAIYLAEGTPKQNFIYKMISNE